MATPFFGQQIAGSSGRTDLPKLRRDFLIDDGCKAMLDFGRKWGYPAQVTPAVNNSLIRPYKRENSNTSVITGTPTWTGGMLNFRAQNQKVGVNVLEWTVAASATNFVVGGFFKLYTTGFSQVFGSGVANADIFNACNSNGALGQYRLYSTYNPSGNRVSTLFGFNGAFFDVTSVFPFDDLVHHVAIEFRQITPTAYQAFLYVDGAQVYASSVTTYTGSINTPTGVAGVGGAYTAYPNCAVGRYWLWDLTVSGSKTVTQLIAADIAQNAGRFS